MVDKCIKVGVAPIISWEHHAAEAFAKTVDRHNYIDWWTRVAEKLKDRNYHLSYNLFTELGIDACQRDCKGSLRRDKIKYNDWTSAVIKAIRETVGGKNADRIIILGSPEKTSLDNKDGSIPEPDVINFAGFFVDLLKSARIPWSLNVIDNYYFTKESKWLTKNQILPYGVPTGAPLNMSRVLDNILDVMN